MEKIVECKELMKQIALFCFCRLGLLSKKEISPRLFRQCNDLINNDDVFPITTTSNIVYKIIIKDSVFYFRECRLHLPPKEYVERIIESYNQIITKGNTFFPEIDNFKSFFNMGTAAIGASRIRKYYHNGNPKFVGLHQCLNDKDKIKQKRFIDYAWSELYLYRLNYGIKYGMPQIFNSVRALSYYKMSELLGLERLVPYTELVKINYQGMTLCGTLMDSAQGIPFLDIMEKDRSNIFEPILQRELNDLNILDVICFEKDHRPDNYNVLLNDNGKVYSISVFDNDSPMSFFISKNISFLTYDGCSNLVDKNGNLNRPFINGNTYDRLNDINESVLINTFDELLSYKQIHSLYKRIIKLREAIKKSINKTCKLIYDDEWNFNTVQEELCGKYGQTYLGLFSSDWKNNNIHK